MGDWLTRLASQVASDLQRKALVARTVGVKLRYDDFRIVTRSLTMPTHTDDAATLRLWAARSLKSIDLDRKLRLMGVKVEGLRDKQSMAQDGAAPPMAQESLPLF